jgi:hypothetical protein
LLDLDIDAPEMLLRKAKERENEAKESKELQARREEPDKKWINLTALKGGIPVITVDRTSEAFNLPLRSEIRKRVERIGLAFNAEILSAPDPNRTIANIAPRKGNVVAKVRFVNGVTKWAIFDAIMREKAVLLS